jgi:hypothetical protein
MSSTGAPGQDSAVRWLEAGMVYDLTDAYAENDWQVYDFAKEQVTVDGKIYGIPGEMETIGVYYNKKDLLRPRARGAAEHRRPGGCVRGDQGRGHHPDVRGQQGGLGRRTPAEHGAVQ